jgi:hypothetical protein
MADCACSRCGILDRINTRFKLHRSPGGNPMLDTPEEFVERIDKILDDWDYRPEAYGRAAAAIAARDESIRRDAKLREENLAMIIRRLCACTCPYSQRGDCSRHKNNNRECDCKCHIGVRDNCPYPTPPAAPEAKWTCGCYDHACNLRGYCVNPQCDQFKSPKPEAVCPRCNGTRMVRTDNASMNVNLPCPDCHGTGERGRTWRGKVDRDE